MNATAVIPVETENLNIREQRRVERDEPLAADATLYHELAVVPL